MTQTTIDTQEIAKFNRLSKHWWDKNGPLKTLHDLNATRLEFITRYAEIKNHSILDVGCGGGILSESLAMLGGIVTGIDAEESAVTVARSHAQSQQIPINYLCAPIEDIELDPFDVITCMEMLEHVAHPHAVIHHCSRLLKTGGYLFLSTINRTLKAYGQAILAAEYILNLLPRQTHEYAKFLKPSELDAMAREEHLALKSMVGMSYNPFTRQAKLIDSVEVNYLMCFVKI